MNLRSRLRSWTRTVLRRSRVESDMDTELRSHIETYADDLVRTGIPREEALRRARAEFGGIERVKEECRESRGVSFVESAMQDLRFAFRMLRKSPGFTAVAVLTLALGIGANTAIFSLINAVLLQDLPVKNPQQLVLFQWDGDTWPPMFNMTGWWSSYAFSYPAFDAFRGEKTTLSGVFAFVPLGSTDQNTTVGINGEPATADGMMVTGEYFSTLGVTSLLGRTLTEADENPAAPRAVVISYAYWSRRFAQDPAIIGKPVTLNGIPFTIVGVAPRDFYGASVGTEPDLWVPFDDKPNMRPWSQSSPDDNKSVFTSRNWLCLNIIGRLKSGVTTAQAQSALDTIFRHFVAAEWHPANPNDAPRLTLAPGSNGLPVLQQRFEQPLYILMVAVGLVLLIACANVATLLLARATSRAKEVSVRLAVGASRSRLIRQLLTESVLLSALGGLVGLAFANWGTKALLALLSHGGDNNSKIILDASVDWKVLLFMFGIATLTGILFGLAPALRTSKMDLSSAIKDNATSLPLGREKYRFGQSLIVVQVAASFVLMIGAGLFARTLVNYEKSSFGFDQRNLLAFALDPTRDGYNGPRLVTFYSQLLDRIQALPGVTGASMIADEPLSGWSGYSRITMEGSQKKSTEETGWTTIGPDFFGTMRIPIVMGRGITLSDTADSPKVAVVDETFVKAYLRGENPIGRRFSIGSNSSADNSYEIVGVSRHAELIRPNATHPPRAYMAYAQDPKSVNQMFFEVRSQGPPATIISELRDAVHQADASLPLIGLKTQAEETSEALTLQRLFARLTTVFGLLALALAMIGLYGTVAYSVTRKTHEIGIRMALGAKPAAVLGMVIRQGTTLALIGVAIGVLAALGATRLIASMIYGVTSYDPLTFVVVAAILSVVALAACYIPARRAMKVDPIVALRYE
ncbi:MAG TPA: ABC transporter permease [Candidatus Acidoferrales bacterium]|nr:ABC transporter permease [Candidatus Acidoferrales bacterium]